MESSALGKEYKDGEVILRQGESLSGMYVVQDGKVAILHERDGNDVLLTVLGERDFFGEVPFLQRVHDPGVVRATAKAKGEARILTVDKKTIVRRIHEDPSLAHRILETMSRRVRELEEEIIRLVSE